MSLLGDFLKQVLDREEVQKAAASLLVDFFKPRPGLEGAKPVVITIEPEEVKDEKASEKSDGPS